MGIIHFSVKNLILLQKHEGKAFLEHQHDWVKT